MGPAGFHDDHVLDGHEGRRRLAVRRTRSDGTDYQNKITFLEVVRPERLVYRHGGDKDCEPANFQTTVTFEEQAGKTRLTMRMLFPSANARNYTVKTYGAVEGLDQTLDRLLEYVANR